MEQLEQIEKKIREMAATLMKAGYSQSKAINRITQDLKPTGIGKATVYYAVTGRYL